MLEINKTAYLFIFWKINVTQLIDQNIEICYFSLKSVHFVHFGNISNKYNKQ